MNNPPPPSQSLEEQYRRRAASSTTYQEHSASSTNDDGHHYPLQYPPPRSDHYRDVRQVAPVGSSPGGLHTSSPPHLPPLSNSHHHPQYHHLLATAETASDSSSGDGGSPDHHRGLTHHHPSFNYGVSGCSSRDHRDIMNSVTSWPLPPAPAMSFDLSSPSLTGAVERMTVTGTSSSPSSSPSSPPATASSSSGPLKKRRKIFENEQMDESNNNNVVSEECCDRRDEKNNAEDQHDAITVTTYADQEAILMRDHLIITTFPSHHHHHHHKTSFPIILHDLLSMQHKDSSYISPFYSNDDGNRIVRVEEAMEWLPHGKGFRILRYEQLLQNILPKAFPTLCDCGRNDDTTTPMTDGRRKTAIMEEQRGEIVVTMNERGNINVNKQQEQHSKYFSDHVWVDSFLWHMKAWGFQEITMGVDRGSFFHEMFIKESPNLCKSMRMIPQQPTLRTPSPLEMPVTPISSSLSRNAKTPVSSIYKPPRLSVPMLRDTNSYEANNFRVGNDGRYQQQQQHQQYQKQYPQQHFQYSHQQHYQQQQQQYYQQHHFPLSYPQPPPTFRSPRTIRFIDEQHQELVSSSSSSSSAAITSDSVEVTPNLERNQKERKKLSSPATGCTVSKRGRRPTVISRHASH